MRNKFAVGGMALVIGFLLATNPVVVNAAGQITSGQIKNNAIKSKDIKDNQIKSADVKNGALTAADLAAGTIPTVPKVRWALVNRTHDAILAQSGGISIAATIGAGVYLNMGANVAGASISATNGFIDADNTFRGSIQATICGGAPNGGTCAAPGTNTTSHVWVFTQNTANTAGENHAFYVTVIG